MSPIFTTFLTSIIATIAVPWAETHFHITVPADQKTALQAGAVGIATASAHWLHVKIGRLFAPARKHK
jgi:hypothetical protein